MEDSEVKSNAMMNFSRYRPDSKDGFYESYFQRANHPSKPIAFWNRYTIFVPKAKSQEATPAFAGAKARPQEAIGELWGIYFDGEKHINHAFKEEFPINVCNFTKDAFKVNIGSSTLDNLGLKGQIKEKNTSTGSVTGKKTKSSDFEWDLKYSSEHPPLYPLPQYLYNSPLPKAKLLVGHPLSRYNGELKVNGETIKINDWLGSQNHNWGSQHTDRYAWGQVSGFDNEEDAFLECATAQIKLGPFYTPKMTTIVLRYKGQTYNFNDLSKAFSNSGSYEYFNWKFSAKANGLSIEGEISANKKDFVGLNYYNPPGGSKSCLNSKIASARVKLYDGSSLIADLQTDNRAAFEILTDKDDHGLEIRT